MRLLFLAGLTAAALGLSACTAETTEVPAAEAQASTADALPKAKQVSFKVDGMT